MQPLLSWTGGLSEAGAGIVLIGAVLLTSTSLNTACAHNAPESGAMAPHAGWTGRTATLRGDSPGAISYDVYRQLRPVNAERLALFVGSGEVKMLSDGLQICMVHDDGVSDPNAV